MELRYSKIITWAGGRKVFYPVVMWAVCVALVAFQRLESADFQIITIAVVGFITSSNALAKFATKETPELGELKGE